MLLPSREWVLQKIESNLFERVVVGAILINSIVLGLETYRGLYGEHRTLFTIVDTAFLIFFVCEIATRIYAHGFRFFRDGWNWFDFVIVSVSLLPFLGNFSALRILRALRLLNVVPEFRNIIESLVRALKGATAVFGILALFFYVFAVMSSKFFGEAHPEHFGNLQQSIFTHLRLMVFDGWGEIVDQTILTHGYQTFWYFVAFSVTTGLVLLSMLIGVMVEAKQSVTNERLLREIEGLPQAFEQLSKKKED